MRRAVSFARMIRNVFKRQRRADETRRRAQRSADRRDRMIATSRRRQEERLARWRRTFPTWLPLPWTTAGRLATLMVEWFSTLFGCQPQPNRAQRHRFMPRRLAFVEVMEPRQMLSAMILQADDDVSPVTGAFADGASINDTQPVFTLGATDLDTHIDAAIHRVSDGTLIQAFNNVTDLGTITPTSALSADTYVLRVRGDTDSDTFDPSSGIPSGQAQASLTFTVDTVAPTVTIDQAGGQADPTDGGPIEFTVVFSEATSDFATGDVTLSGTAGATTGTVTGGPITYSVAVSGMTGSGTVIASIAAGKAHDDAGNPNEASTTSDATVQYNVTDVGLDVDGNLVVEDTTSAGQPDTITVSRVNVIGTDYFRIASNHVLVSAVSGTLNSGTTTIDVPVSQIASGKQLIFRTAGGNDSLTVNLNTSLGRQVNYDGGAGGSDSLTVSYTGNIGALTSNLTGSGAGNIDVGSDSSQEIVYSNLEPTTLPASTNLVINVVAGSTTGVLKDDMTANNGVSMLDFPSGGPEDQIFPHPTASLTINLQGSSSKVTLASMDASASAGIPAIVLSGASGDRFEHSATNALRTGASLTVTTATLDLKGFSQTTGGLNGTGTIDNSAGSPSTLTVNGGGAFDGVLTDSGSSTLALTKSSSGTLTLSGANTYSGDTTVSAGTLRAAHNSAFGNAGTVRLAGTDATLELAQGITIARPLIVDNAGDNKFLQLQSGASSGAYSGTITIAETSAEFDLIADTGGSLTISGTIGNNATSNQGIVKLGAGTVVLSNSGNSYKSETRVRDGILKLGANNVLPDIDLILTPSVAGATAALDLAGYSDTVGNITLGAGTPTVAGLTSRIIDSVGSGILKLGGTVTYNRGDTGVNNGQATVSADLDLNGATRTFTINDSDQTTAELVISGTIQDSSGAGGVTKSGAGVLVLSGNNTYSGLTNVTLGTLVASHANALGTTVAGTTVSNNASLIIANVTSSEPISISGVGVNSAGALQGTGTAEVTGTVTLTANSSVGASGAGDTLTLSGQITETGSRSLTKVGDGTVVFSNASNNYTGATIVSAGTLRLGASGVIPDGTGFGSVTVNSPGQLDLAGHDETINGLAGTGTVDNSVAGTCTLTVGSGNATGNTFSGAIKNTTGTVNLTKLGSGTQILSGTNTYAGLTLVTDGRLQLNANNALADSSTLEVNGPSAVFHLNNVGDTVAGVTLTQGTISGGSPALTSTSDFLVKSGTINANLGGSVGLSKTTTGTVELQHISSYTGDTNVQTGTLKISDNFALGTTAGKTVVSSGATLNLNLAGQTTAEPLQLNGTGVGGAGALTSTGSAAVSGSVTLVTDASIGVAVGGDTLALSGQITGAGSLTKVGAGTLTLSNANTNDYAGDTVISAGTLRLSADNVIPDGTGKGNVIVIGTLALTRDESINGLSGSGTINHAGSVSRELTVGLNDQDGNFSGTINDPTANANLALTKQGAGVLTLSGNNTYEGVTNVQAGILIPASATALGSTGAGTTVASGATLKLQDGLTYAEPLTLNGAGVSGSGALHSASGTNTWNSTIDLASSSTIAATGGSNLTITGEIRGTNSSVAKTLTLSMGAGTLNVAAISGRAGGAVNALGLTTVNLNSAGTANFNGPIKVSGNVTQSAGTGTTTFSGGGTIGGALSVTANVIAVQTSPLAVTGAVGLNAVAGVGIDAGLSGGSITIDADSDDNAAGVFSNTATVSTGGGTIRITASDVAISGVIDATSSGRVVLAPSTAVAIGLGSGGTFALSTAEANVINASVLEIDANAFASAVTFGADVDLASAPQTVTTLVIRTLSTVTGTAGGVVVTNMGIVADGAVNLTDPTTAVSNVAINTSGDAVTFVQTSGFSVGTVDSGSYGLTGIDGSTISLTATTGNVSVNGNVAGSDAVTITLSGDNGLFIIAGGNSVSTSANGVAVSADQMTLTGTISASGQTVTLKNSVGADPIDLGGANAAGKLALDDAELDNITAARLVIGTAAGGAITVSADIDLTDSPAIAILRLNTGAGAGVTATAGGIKVANLAIDTAGAVTFSDPDTNVTNLAVKTTTGNIRFTEANGLTVDAVDGLNGLDTDSGSVTLAVVAGGLTVNNTGAANDIDATTGISLTLQGNDAVFTVSTDANLATVGNTAGNDITVTADEMDLAGTMAAGGSNQIVTLQPQNAGEAITLGANPGTANRLELSDAEIDNVTAGKVLRIGRASAGSITLAGGISPANATVLRLMTGAAMVDDNAANPDVSVADLAISSATGIAATGTDAAGGLEVLVINLAFQNSTSGSVQFTEAAGGLGITVNSVDGLATSFNHGTTTTITAYSPIEYAVDTTSGGTITDNAVESAPTNFDNITVNAGVTVRSTGGDVVFNAGDRIIINGTVQSDTGSVTLTSGVADTDNDGSQTLDGTVSATSGTVTIDLSAQAGTASQAGTGTITAGSLLLNSTVGGGSFSLAASTTNNVGTLAAAADGPIAYRDTNALTIGTVGTTHGIATTDDQVTLTVGGLLTIGDGTGADSISVGGGTVDVLAAGVTETAADGSIINAANLRLQGTGTFTLTNANTVGTLAAGVTGALSYTDADALTIGSVTANSVTTDGIATGGNDVTLTTGALTIGDGTGADNINAGSGTVDINAAGAGEAGTSIIHAANLRLRGTGTFTLTNANTVGTLAAAVTGAVSYTDLDALTIGSVTANSVTTSGITTGNPAAGGAVVINAGGLLTVAEPVDTSLGSGGVLRVGSGVTLDAGLTLGAGSITLNGGGAACHILINSLQSLAGDAYFRATCDVVVNASVTTTAGGNVELSGDFELNGSGGVLVTASGSLDIAGSLAATGSALTTDNGGTYTGNSVAVTNGVATPDVKAAGTIQIGDGNGAPAGADTVIDGQVQTTGALQIITVTGEQDVRFGAAASLTALSGKVTVTADTGSGNDGVIFMADGAVINAGSGDIGLDAAGNITLGSIQTTSTSTTAVTIDTGAAVADGGDTAVDIVADTGTVVINAVSGVGSGNPLETTIGTVDVDNLTSGNIELAETNGITVNKLAEATAGNISLTSITGTVTVATGQNGVSVVGIGTILLWADGGDAGDLVVNDTVTSVNGSITLRADNDVSFSVEGDVTSTGGSIEVTADFDNGGAGSGGLTMADNGTSDSTVINAGSGTIDLNADENIVLGSVQTTSPSATAVTIDTTEGGVTDAGDTAVDIVANSGTVVINAVTGIGHGNDIDTTIGTLVATNSTSGDIVVQETDGLTIGGTGVRTLNGDGNIHIDVDAGGLIVDGVVTAHGDGNVTLNVDDGGATLNATVSSTSGLIVIAANSVAQNDPAGAAIGDISTGTVGAEVGTVQVTADDGGITMTDGTTTTSGTGQITYSATGNVALSLLTGASGDIVVTAGSGASVSGAIMDNRSDGSGGDGGSNLITTGTATLTAETGIGSAGGAADIDTTVGTLEATNHLSGNIVIQETDGLIVGGTGVQTLAGDGNINVDVDAGNLTVDSVVTAHGSGSATLNVDAGAANLNAAVSSTTGPIAITADRVNQNAGGNIGTGGSATIQVTADAGDITMADGTTTTGGSGQITYSATNDIALSLLTSSGATIVVTADSEVDGAGAISDIRTGELDDGTPAFNIVGFQTALRAGSGIGSDADGLVDLDLQVTNLVARTRTGDIHLRNSGALNIETVDGLNGVTITNDDGTATAADNIIISATSPVTITDSDPTVNHDGGNIVFAAEGAVDGDDLTINADITVTNGDGILDGDGNIMLIAGDSVVTQASSTRMIATDNAGQVILLAGTDFNNYPVTGSFLNGFADGDVVMGDGSQIRTDDGVIALLAPDDVLLSIVNANADGDGTLGNVVVEADFAGVQGTFPNGTGAITDNLSGEAANVVAGSAIFLAYGAAAGSGAGIGDDSADIDTQIANLAASTERGDIVIDNTGTLTIGNGSGGAVSISLPGLAGTPTYTLSGVTIVDNETVNDANNSLTDNILISASSPLTVDASNAVVNNDGGNLTLAAEGNTAGDDLTLYDDVTVTGGDGTIDGDGNITLYAGDTINLAAAGVAVSVDASGTILLSAGSNYNSGSVVDGSSTGDVLMTSGSSVTSADGNITVLAPGNVQLSIVNADSNASGAVGDVIVTADYAGPGGGTNYASNNLGAITDNLTGSEAANITADQAALRAGSGIGDGEAPNDDDIDVAIVTLAAVTESGDIHVQDLAGGLTIDAFDGLSGVTITDAVATSNSTLDDITIRSSTWLTVAAGNPVANNDGGNITLAAEGTTGSDDLTVHADVTVTGGDGAADGDGNIFLYAGHSIRLALSSVDITTNNAGSILLSAGSHYNNGSPIDGDSVGDVTMTSGSVVSSHDGSITVLAPNNVALSIVNADGDGDDSRGNVTITADYTGPAGAGYASNNAGAISDSLTGETATDINIIANLATLSAGTGIGSADDLDTDVVTLDAVNTGTSGDIQIQEVAAGADGYIGVQQLVQTSASGTGNILLTTVDGTIEVLAGGSGVSVASAGRTITLDANVTDGSHELPQGAIPVRGNTELYAVVSGHSGLITIDADHDVLGGTAGVITGGSGGIKITADANINAAPPLGNNNGTIQLAGDISAVGGTVTFSLADCDGWVGATPGSTDGDVTAANIVMGVDANTPEGVLRLQGGANTFTGMTTVVEGTLLVNGVLTDSVPGTPANGDVVVQSGGVLGGHGNGATPPTPFAAATYGVINASITVQNGGILDPGDVSSGCVPQTGVLTVNVPSVPGAATVTIQLGGIFRIQLAGLTPGAVSGGYDQLVLNGNGNLNGALLDGAGGGTLLVEPRFAIPVGAEFVIISKLPDPELDTRFLDLPEGGFLSVDNVVMNISYVASDRARNDTFNNDVVLTAPGRYDFNGFGGHTEPTYSPVSPFQTHPDNTAGWVGTLPYYFERFSAGDPGWDRLRYDGHSTNPMGDPLTFRVNVLAGKTYEVMILTGSPNWNYDKESFTVVGSAVGDTPSTSPEVNVFGAGVTDGSGAQVAWGGGTPNTNSGYYRWVRLTTTVGGTLGTVGTITMTMDDLGGGSGSTVILAMDIRPVDTVGTLTVVRDDPPGTSPLTTLPADGATKDKYTGTGAPPYAVLTVTASAGGQYAPVTPDTVPVPDVPATANAYNAFVATFGGQVKADQYGNFEFWVQRPAKLVSPTGNPPTENWTITVEESSGLSRGVALQPYKAPTVDAAAENALRFDFGTSASPVQKYGTSLEKQFLQVIPQTSYNATRGYGWLSRVAGNDRRDTTTSALRTDFNSGSNATFRVDVPNGTYSIRLYHSNPLFFGSVPYTTNPFTVTVQGTPYNVPVIPPGTTFVQPLSGVSVSGGKLEILFGAGFMISGIDISAGGLPTDTPLLASGVPLHEDGAAISLDMLQPVVAEAAWRWSATGLTPAQTAILANVQFAVADLGGAYLGLANPATNTIRIDDDAAMLGWSVVRGPSSVVNGQWMNGSPGTTDNGQRTTDGIDLLTVVMHELGHLLGYGHSDDADDLMAPVLSTSPLRLSALDSRLPTLVGPLGQAAWQIQPSASSLQSFSRLDGVFADLGRNDRTANDSSDETKPDLLESAEDGLLAARTSKSGDEVTQARVPRRSRMQRYERELDAWFAELAVEENGQ